MIAGALFYYQFHSWRNRLAARIRRLRQPKYLAGAIVGGLYFYFYLFRGFSFGHQPPPAKPPASSEEMRDLPQTMAALFFMVALVLSWILRNSRAAIAFTEAEIAFLFPAPISRKTLINFKLLKSQAAILFSAVLLTLIRRRWGGGHFLIHALGWWAAMSVFNLHMLGSSFAVTMLMDRGLSNWKRRALILGALAAAAAAVYLWLRHSLPPLPSFTNQSGMAWFFRYLGQVFGSGPLPYLLLPFQLVVAPYFADSFMHFLAALVPVLGLIWLHYLWVIHSNVAFEEASIEFSRKLAERIAAARAGNLQAARRPKKAARPPFVLRPSGYPAVALFWKNLISAGQYVTARFWLMLVWIAIVGGTLMRTPWTGGGGNFGSGVIICAGMLLAMSLFTGPQILRNDLRQDLPLADVLKSFPMPGWQIVLGEVLAPAAILACLQWLVIVFGIFQGQFGKLPIPLALRLSLGLAAAVVLPFVDLVALMIPNASALFFPAWFHLGKDVPRGFETIGQQLILMFGQVLVLALGLAPAGGVFTLFLLGGSYVHWPMLGLVLGAFAAAAILAIEVGIAIKLLGGVFERFDVAGELPA
jgi:ABC-2 type transport system permease protein